MFRSIHSKASLSSASSFSSTFSRISGISPQLSLSSNHLSFKHKIPQRNLRSPAPQDVTKNVTVLTVQKKKDTGIPITMVTAYDYPSAVHVDQADIDMLLVGDSVGMVQLGYDTTVSVTMEEMIFHCRSVTRGAQRPLIIADMPFGSYEVSDEQAHANAIRFLKEGGAQAVKLEGGKVRASTVRKLVQSGISVMAHVGLTPQSISTMGGFRPQGKTAVQAAKILEDALALEEAGAFSIVIECVPERVAEVITQQLRIPTIGIGAGSRTDGQVLVYHDLTGMMQHPHHRKVTPKFCKQYCSVGELISEGLEAFRDEVKTRKFPSEKYSPYLIPEKEWATFLDLATPHLRRPISTPTTTAPPSNPPEDKQKSTEGGEDVPIKVY